MSFSLAPQLDKDCYHMGKQGDIHVLLNRNALFPWFILIPDCSETELYRLHTVKQIELLSMINMLSRFIESQFTIDKLNVATIGNIVSQLHIHVVGRSKNDPCWPGVVWGCKQSAAYTPAQVEKIKSALHKENICAMTD